MFYLISFYVDKKSHSKRGWKYRLRNEYNETKERYEKLKKHVFKKYAKWVSDGYFGECSEQYSFELMQAQLSVMRKYLDILEMRMALANIPF